MSGNKSVSLIASHETSHKFVVVLAVALFFAGGLHTYWYRHYQPDDAFIYLVYVKSFFNGLGLTFNGELVEGYSSVLWTLLVTLFSWSGLDPLVVSKWLGWASYLALAFMLVTAHRVTKGTSYGALFSLAIYFSVPSLAMWAAGAMETVLFSALIALAAGLYYYARLICSLSIFFAFAGLSFALVALTRPEGFALIGVVFAFEFIMVLHGKKLNWRGTLLTVGIYFLLTALMFLGRFLVYGKWFPATVGAKTGSLSVQVQHGLAYLSGYVQEHMVLVVAYALSLGYVFFVVRRKNFEQYLLVWMLAILIFGYLAFNWLVGGDWMIGWRFITPVIPFIALTIGLSLACMSAWVSFPLAILVAMTVLVKSQSLYQVSLDEVKATRGDIIIGQYIKKMALSPSEKIAVVDAGAIPYFSGLPTIDMVGLNDAYLSSLPGGFMQKYDNNYVLSNKPRVVQFHTRFISSDGNVAPSDSFIGGVNLYYNSEFQSWYEHDKAAPIPQVFIRRENPLEKTFLDTFFWAKITGNDLAGRLSLSLEKTGDGVWVAPLGGYIQAGGVYVRVRVSEINGRLIREDMLPIPNNMVSGDVVDFDLEGYRSERLPYKISACPVLAGVREMEPCLNGNTYEYVVSGEQDKLTLGDYRFDDGRLMLLGWSGLETEHVWSLGQDSVIKFDVEDVSAVSHVYLTLMPFGGQRLAIDLNGVEVYQGVLDSPGQIALQVAGVLQNKNELRLRHPDARQVGEHDRRVVAFALKGISLK